MLAKGATLALLLLLAGAACSTQTRLFGRPIEPSPRPQYQNRRSFEQAQQAPQRRDAVFDPDVLNRFLEEYASKIKRTTELPLVYVPEQQQHQQPNHHPSVERASDRNGSESDAFDELTLNDTIKRHKFYNSNSHPEDRNSGWVTLDAVPWSKSKISKWQANPTTQGPFPGDAKPWESKPGFNNNNNNKPWNSEFSSRPPYDNTKPWQNHLTSKPSWADNSPAASNKPWYSQERPRPDRPTSGYIDKFEENPNQAQKWPPERPSWDRYPENPRPSSDIITDDTPPNFPNNNWDRPIQRPSYTHHMESYVNEAGSGWHDRDDNFGNKFSSPAPPNRPGDEYFSERPHFSQYQYPSTSGANHPSSHPSSGDGQWVLLSTNRGYSKSRQRSIKLETLVNPDAATQHKKKHLSGTAGDEEKVPAVTSKRQVRLTVLPSINGTNTTTSHGGLLEVERTFKTVEQSQREYEEAEKSGAKKPIVISKRPIRNTITGVAPSNSAVLAAVGAGMLPATMAMMIPMMLGKRRRRSLLNEDLVVKMPHFSYHDELYHRRI